MIRISNNRAERIARNINAMDMSYNYSDDMKVWKFWNVLRKKLIDILSTLSDNDKNTIIPLCKEEKAKYFNLI